MTNPPPWRSWLDRLDTLPAWQFLLVLYVARWGILLPFLMLSPLLFNSSQLENATLESDPTANAAMIFVAIVVLAPFLETLVECAIPYAIFAKIRNYRCNPPQRPWGFIVVSASIMALAHPMAAALAPAFITGFFLAYCYAHFAPYRILYGIAATVGFHAAINIIGWTMLVFASGGPP